MNTPETKQDKFIELWDRVACLRFTPGWSGPKNRDFNPINFERWALKAKQYEQLAAQFVLTVWDPNQKWKIGEFGFWEAARLWKFEDRIGLAAWIYDPFFVTKLR